MDSNLSFIKYFQNELKVINDQQLLRKLESLSGSNDRYVNIGNEKLLNFCSNNYLGLANYKPIREASKQALDHFGSGSGGARLLSGSHKLHSGLEESLCRYRNVPSALLFNSGYSANIGILAALAKGCDHILFDELNHASLVDGLLLSKKPFTRYPHCDIQALEKALRISEDPTRVLVVTETLFSMEGSFAPLEEIVTLQDKYGFFLYLDEAHSVGCYPHLIPETCYANMDSRLIMGTFGKAYGSYGAYALGSPECISFLINTCRSFIFSTSLPAAVIAANQASLEIAAAEKWRAEHLLSLSTRFRESARELDFNLGRSQSHIIPIILGENEKALAAMHWMREKGIYASAVRYPTVPKGQARLRINICAQHQQEDVDQMSRLLIELKGDLHG